MLLSRHQMCSNQWRSKVCELQSQALLVLACSSKRQFGRERCVNQDVSHQVCCWGSDESTGKEGGGKKSRCVMQDNTWYVSNSFKSPWWFAEVCLQIQVAVKLSNWSILPLPRGHFSRHTRASTRVSTLYSGIWKLIIMNFCQSLVSGRHAPSPSSSWRMPWWKHHLVMRRRKCSWKSRRQNRPSTACCGDVHSVGCKMNKVTNG